MSNLKIRTSKIHGRGVFSKVKIPKGTQMFLVADLKEYDKRDIMTVFGKLVNHKRDANCDLTDGDDNGLVYLRSLKNIYPNEELTINYAILPFPFKSDVSGYRN